MIEARSLTRRFGDFTAVSQVSLSVPAGSVLALLGQNGAGKTTTVRMLSALLSPTEGEAFVNGYDVRKNPDAVRACVGLVTDVPGLFEQMSVPAYLDFFGSLYGMPTSMRIRRINELLEFFELTAHIKEKMVGFSKGMKQKVALARALIHEPTVLFLDEPTSGLDPLAARSVRELILELKQTRRAIVLCTHDLDEAERLADTVAIMRQGQIVAHDTPAALRAQFSDETVVRIEFAQPCPLSLDALSTTDGLHNPQFSAATNSALENTLLTYRTPAPAQLN
nr:ABC transporter ATP-binding protein [Ktedonobacteraceae bacterium]